MSVEKLGVFSMWMMDTKRAANEASLQIKKDILVWGSKTKILSLQTDIISQFFSTAF